MKRIFALAVFALSAATGAVAQGNLTAATDADPVVMTINGTPVARSEFERAYNRNKATGTSVDDYVDLYINYRLKIDEAMKQHLDTTKGYRDELATYRDDMIMKYVDDPQYRDSVVRSVYDNIQQQLKDSDILSVSHIFLVVPQKAGDAQKQAVKARIDSIYDRLKAGADFAEMAKSVSQDYVSARQGGELPDFGPGATLKEFEDQCYKLKAGQMSEPFESTAGYHIVLMRKREKLPPYQQKKDELISVLNKQGLQQMVFNHAVEKLVKASGGLSRDEVLNKVEREHEAQDTEMKYLMKDYREGLLAYDITKREVWDKAEKDTVGLENFFKKNKKNYQWDAPRFKGFVFHTTEEAMVKPVKAVLKKYGDKNWSGEIKKQFNADGKENVAVSHGLWKQGENRYVDKYIFGDSSIEIKETKRYPYFGIEGKLLKKGPEVMTDVRAQVTSDYQDAKEKEWVNSLREKSKVEVNRDVVKTVNNH